MALQDSAVLSWLHMARWTARCYDAEASAYVHSEFQTDDDAGRFNKQLMPASWVRPIERFINATRREHYKMTLPWLDNGSRMLPVKMIFDYSEVISSRRDKWDALVKTALDEYPIILEEKRRLGRLYHEDDFPTMKQLTKKFRFEHVLHPIPTSTDFRIEVNELEKKNYETKLAEVTQNAVQDVYKRIHKVVNHLRERLNEPDPERLHASMLHNVTDLVDILPKLNITNDPTLDELRHRLERDIVEDTTIERLRLSAPERKSIANTASDILESMKSFMEG